VKIEPKVGNWFLLSFQPRFLGRDSNALIPLGRFGHDFNGSLRALALLELIRWILRLHHSTGFGKSKQCRHGQSPSTDQQALSARLIPVNQSS
jgi:hypothetical protein